MSANHSPRDWHITPQSLATYEAQAKAYRELFQGADGYPANLTEEAYLVCEVVPALIAEMRSLRAFHLVDVDALLARAPRGSTND